MFERVILRRAENGIGLSLGELAEALLLYQNVHLVIDQQSLHSLGQGLGLKELIGLIKRRRFTAIYVEDMLMSVNGIVTGGYQEHAFVTGKITGRKGESRRQEVALRSKRGRLQLTIERMGKSAGEARKLTDALLNVIDVTEFSGDRFVSGGVHKAATETLHDADYVLAALRCVLRRQVGFEQYVETLESKIIKVDAGKFLLRTNIDFAEGNRRRKQMDPTLGEFAQGNLIVPLLDAASDLNIAAHYAGDFYTSGTNSEIVRMRCSELLRRTDISSEQRAQFQEIVLDDCPSLREVIDNGERSFAEFERLLDSAGKFRETIHGLSPDGNLVREYFHLVAKEGWISRLPAKAVRYVFGLLLGDFGATAGAVYGIADTFLLDKLKGWRPNHFVETRLKPFLGT